MGKAGTAPQKSLIVSDCANSVLQNRINTSIIFNYLRDHASAYRAQISRDLGISAPAVSRAIGNLLEDGYVTESEKVQVKTGKKAVQISVNAGRGYIVGVDILADPLKIAISDFAGKIQATIEAAPITAGVNFCTYLNSSIEALIGIFEKKSHRSNIRLLGVGIAVPAVVDPRTGAIVDAILYENIADSNLCEKVGARFATSVFIENVSSLAAIAEWKRGVGRGTKNLLFINISKGIGAGMIVDGDLYRGSRGAAGEIGYFITDRSGLTQGGRKIGYLESLASIDALAQGGERVEEAVNHLAMAVVDTMIVLNPEIVIIGGAVCEMPGFERIFLDPLIEKIKTYYPFQPVTVCKTSLGSEASLIGAVQMTLDAISVHAYPYRL